MLALIPLLCDGRGIVLGLSRSYGLETWASRARKRATVVSH
ncbi:hypothetical protein PSCLAVI8L_220056 [Pseudoclavibacter sp. 8L]|nr:hypothetical protein PSCLAVI8L_220056 [Pseudoclavibacter sp. 8L]